MRVRSIVGARVTLASGSHVNLRLRRVRAGTTGSIVRLRLPRATGRYGAVLTIRVDRKAPTAPRHLAANAGNARMRLTWKRAKGPGVHGYKIMRNGKQIGRTVPASSTSMTLTGLANGKAYTVSVVAVDAAGNVSPASNPVSATPGAGTVPAATLDTPPTDAPTSGKDQVPSPDPAPIACDRFAATTGSDSAAGTSDAPFATAQKLLDALTPGQTGCLRSGTYSEYELKAHHGGTAAAPIILASAPGEHAKIVVDTDVYFPVGITDLHMRNLNVTNNPASGVTQAVMIQDFSDRSVWDGNDINGNSDAHCMELGWAGHGTAHGTLIRRNRFHNCGDPANGTQDHAIYVSQSVGATITENLFWHTAAYGIHLYPSADDTVVTHNVIVDSGQSSVIFASDQDPGTGRMSDNNTVAYNVLANSAHNGIDVYWGESGQGVGNVARDNCMSGNSQGGLHAALPGISLSGNVDRPVSFVDAASHDYRLAPGDACLGVIGFDTAALVAAQS